MCNTLRLFDIIDLKGLNSRFVLIPSQYIECDNIISI